MAPRNGPVLKQFLGHARLMLPALAVWSLLALPGVGQGRGRGWGYGRATMPLLPSRRPPTAWLQ